MPQRLHWRKSKPFKAAWVTLLTLFLMIPITVASAERSFSKLKLIKTYLRSTMGQPRLADLAILSIENAEAKIMDFSNLIKQFASVNAVRERKFWCVERGIVLLSLFLTFKIPCPTFSFNIVGWQSHWSSLLDFLMKMWNLGCTLIWLWERWTLVMLLLSFNWSFMIHCFVHVLLVLSEFTRIFSILPISRNFHAVFSIGQP